jgi:hypothetical protein
VVLVVRKRVGLELELVEKVREKDFIICANYESTCGSPVQTSSAFFFFFLMTSIAIVILYP